MGVWERQLDMWTREWSGPGFNGRCLMEELRAHSADQASSDRNLEEYTVWAVALHVHKYKEMMLAELEGRAADYPAGDDDFPPVPDEGLTEKRWAEVIAVMAQTHEALVSKALPLDESFLETEFPPWKITWGEAFAWAVGHDSYHTAQIRNMKR